MPHTRRVFMGAAASLAAAAAIDAAAQRREPGPLFPIGPPDQADSPIPPLPSAKSNRAMLKANQEEIKKDVARMAELIDQLQKDLDNSDTKEVLSLGMVHKSEEIEKLAKHVKDLVRG